VRSWGRVAALSAALIVGGQTRSAIADEASPPAAAPAQGEGATAEQIVMKLEADTRNKPEARVVAEPATSARRAFQRARGARAAGDTAHARQLDGLALEWAQTAEALLRAAHAEQARAKAEAEAHAVSTQLDRARALLSETQARRGLTAAELERVEGEAAEAAKAAAAAEAARLDKGRKKKGAAADKAPTKDAPTKKGATR